MAEMTETEAEVTMQVDDLSQGDTTDFMKTDHTDEASTQESSLDLLSLSLEQSRSQVAAFISTFEQLLMQQVTTARTLLVFGQTLDAIKAVQDGLVGQIRAISLTFEKRAEEAAAEAAVKKAWDSVVKSNQVYDYKIMKTENGQSTYYRVKGQDLARFLKEGLNPADYLPKIDDNFKGNFNKHKRGYCEEDVAKLHAMFLKVDSRDNWTKMRHMIEAVAKEYEDDSIGKEQIKNRIRYMKDWYLEGKPMLKGEVEFLNYFVNDLHPRLKERDKAKQTRQSWRLWNEEDMSELNEKIKEVLNNGVVYCKSEELFNAVMESYPKDHFIHDISDPSTRMRTRHTCIVKKRQKELKLIDSEIEFEQLYYEVLTKVKAAKMTTTIFKPPQQPTSKRFKRERELDT